MRGCAPTFAALSNTLFVSPDDTAPGELKGGHLKSEIKLLKKGSELLSICILSVQVGRESCFLRC